MERCKKYPEDQELEFYRKQFIEATRNIYNPENKLIDEEYYNEQVNMQINGKTNWNIFD